MKKLAFLSFWAVLAFAGPVLAIENDAYKYAQMSSTTTVSIIPVKLHTVTLAGSGVAFTLYDSTSPNVTTTPIAVFQSTVPAQTFIFDLQTQNGLQHIGAAGGNSVTVTYR